MKILLIAIAVFLQTAYCQDQVTSDSSSSASDSAGVDKTLEIGTSDQSASGSFPISIAFSSIPLFGSLAKNKNQQQAQGQPQALHQGHGSSNPSYPQAPSGPSPNNRQFQQPQPFQNFGPPYPSGGGPGGPKPTGSPGGAANPSKRPSGPYANELPQEDNKPFSFSYGHSGSGFMRMLLGTMGIHLPNMKVLSRGSNKSKNPKKYPQNADPAAFPQAQSTPGSIQPYSPYPGSYPGSQNGPGPAPFPSGPGPQAYQSSPPGYQSSPPGYQSGPPQYPPGSSPYPAGPQYQSGSPYASGSSQYQSGPPPYSSGPNYPGSNYPSESSSVINGVTHTFYNMPHQYIQEPPSYLNYNYPPTSSQSQQPQPQHSGSSVQYVSSSQPQGSPYSSSSSSGSTQYLSGSGGPGTISIKYEPAPIGSYSESDPNIKFERPPTSADTSISSSSNYESQNVDVQVYSTDNKGGEPKPYAVIEKPVVHYIEKPVVRFVEKTVFKTIEKPVIKYVEKPVIKYVSGKSYGFVGKEGEPFEDQGEVEYNAEGMPKGESTIIEPSIALEPIEYKTTDETGDSSQGSKSHQETRANDPSILDQFAKSYGGTYVRKTQVAKSLTDLPHSESAQSPSEVPAYAAEIGYQAIQTHAFGPIVSGEGLEIQQSVNPISTIIVS